MDQEDERKWTTAQVPKEPNGVTTGELMLLRDESGGDLCTGQVAPGIEVA